MLSANAPAFSATDGTNHWNGMTQRDLVAVYAMQGIFANRTKVEDGRVGFDAIAAVCYNMADAMIKASDNRR